MSLIKKIFIIFFLLLPISNSFGAMVTYVQKASVADDSDHIQGIEFNVEGTKMFTISRVAAGDNKKTNINLYNLSRPFDVSSTLNNQDVLKPNTIDEAMVSLSHIF